LTNELKLSEEKTAIDSTLMSGEMAKQAQEVQASMIIAKRFPRDINTCYTKIINSCKRKSLAQKAVYVYPKGKKTVTGPSIRLAEAIAQSWCNLDFGIRELSQQDGVSEIEAYCWDKETNTKSTKTFHVKHIRYSKEYGNKALTDPRDIYEMTANQGARRMRNCILAIIPADIVEEAVAQCSKTLIGDNEEPMEDRIRKMVEKFSSIGVTKEMIEMKLGHKIGITTIHEIVNLQQIYQSISDNFADRKAYFDIGDNDDPPTDLAEKLKAKRGKEGQEENKEENKTEKDVNVPEAKPLGKFQEKLFNLLHTEYEGRISLIKPKLVSLTEFDGAEGKVVLGTDDIYNLSDKRAQVAYGKLKKEIKDNSENKKKEDKPDIPTWLDPYFGALGIEKFREITNPFVSEKSFLSFDKLDDKEKESLITALESAVDKQ
jgi:hypothetical protein